MTSQAAEVSIRILIVDDHPVVRAGLASMLGTQAELDVIGSATSGADALRLLEERETDVLLLDLRMPGMSGVETLQALKLAGKGARVIILTNYETDEDIYRAVQAGAQGYLLKDTSLREMLEAIRAVHAGKRYIPRHIASRLAERMVRTDLTARGAGDPEAAFERADQQANRTHPGHQRQHGAEPRAEDHGKAGGFGPDRGGNDGHPAWADRDRQLELHPERRGSRVAG